VQIYASLINYSNEICKERSEEYNFILFGSHSDIPAGCSAQERKRSEELQKPSLGGQTPGPSEAD